MSRCPAAFVALAMLGTIAPLGAQRHSDLDRAAELLAAGRVLSAEALLYQAARQRPRDPAARLALGRHLAARGATRVGAVLLEEARFFGGDPRAVAVELAPLYALLGDYRALAALPQSPLSSAERRRAEWLASNGPGLTLADSAVVPLSESADGVGATLLVIGDDTLVVTIDPATTGLVLDTTWARRSASRLFGATRDARQASGVVREVLIGSAVLRNVPARYTAMSAGRMSARIGMDLLAQFHPSFDERQSLLVLRARPPRAQPGGTRLPTFITRATMLVAVSDTALAITSSEARSILGGKRWTWLSRTGFVVIER